MTAEEIKAFLHNEENILNCAECPYNNGETGDVLPCGQYHCWVEVHTKGEEE